MADGKQVPSVEMLHETLHQNISKTKILSKTDESNIAAIINVMHNHSFDLENKKLEKALDSLVEDILKSI
jgi:hypothetical protein